MDLLAEPFVGRRDDVRVLDAYVADVARGGQALLFEGDAGIGKTTLLTQGVLRASVAGCMVLSAGSAEAETGLVFATIGDAFGPVLTEVLEQLVPPQRRAVEIALARRDPDGRPLDTRVLGLGLLDILTRLAEQAPVVLAFDDVQWADAASAEVLAFALRRVSSLPIGVIGTVRGHPDPTPFGLDRSFPDLRRVNVGPLDVEEIRRLLKTRLGLVLPRTELLQLQQTSGGNPFFALELGRGLVAGTVRVDSAYLSLPDSLSRLMAQRLGSLPSNVGDTLAAVAALATPSVTMLESLAPAAVDDLDLAEQRGIIELDGDRIRFTHPLLASACYTRMPLHRRRQLHRLLADLDVGLEERARHLARATTGPDEQIASALDRASRHATERGASQLAAVLSEQAVDLTPDGEPTAANVRRLAAAHCARSVGDIAKSTALVQQVVDSAEPGPLRAQALTDLADVRSSIDGFRIAENLYLLALAEPGVNDRERANILCDLAWQLDAGGARTDGSAYADQALVLAEQDGDPEALANCRATVAELTFWRTGRIRRDLLDPAVATERALGRDLGARAALARVLGRADEYDEARALLRELIDETVERSDLGVLAHLFFLARMEIAAGEWAQSQQVCDEALEVAAQTGEESTELLCRMMQAELAAARGSADEARRDIAEFMPLAHGTGFRGAAHRLSRALGVLELSCADQAAAWAAVENLFADVDELDEILAQLAGSVAVEALIGLDRLDDAERLLALLERRAAGADSGIGLLAQRSRGLLHAAHGRTNQALACLATAATPPEPPRGVNQLEFARSLLALGAAQRRAQQKRSARETLTQAAELFERLGSTIWADRARSELRRIGGRTASAHQLSETERLIVDAVVEGRTNRDVAAALHLSTHTVAWNLSKIYRKLGVRSRTELAALLIETPLD